MQTLLVQGDTYWGRFLGCYRSFELRLFSFVLILGFNLLSGKLGGCLRDSYHFVNCGG